jgi:hypothetical protein
MFHADINHVATLPLDQTKETHLIERNSALKSDPKPSGLIRTERDHDPMKIIPEITKTQKNDQPK